MPVYEYECVECEEQVVEVHAKLDEYQSEVKAECKECKEETKHKRILSRGTSFRMNFRRTSI